MPLTLAAPQPGLTSDLDMPYLVIVADSYGDYVFARLHPMQAQGEVGMGPCWDHKQRSVTRLLPPGPAPPSPGEVSRFRKPRPALAPPRLGHRLPALRGTHH